MRTGLLHRLFVLFALVHTFSAYQAQASHSMGADLSYRCLGGNNYEVKVSFYRDCFGVNAATFIYINYRSATCGINDSVRAYTIPGTGQEITHICPSARSYCNGGGFTGIQEWVYMDTITLPANCTDWVISYTQCCRNGAITNINSPTNDNLYLFATLNNSTVACNNSPTFSNKPVPFACVNQNFCFSHGATDVDGDSLVYSLITPYQSRTTRVVYTTGYDSSQALSSSPAITFNTATGEICMTPNAIQVTVIAVLVKEYRNGVLIGSVERDIQITVMTCSNNLPSATGINGTNVRSDTLCADVPYCFTIGSIDPDVSQNTFLTWDTTIAGATFTVDNAFRSSAQFCWTPTKDDISPTPHCFTVTVEDDNCPYYGYQVYSYCLTVQGITVNAGADQTALCNTNAVLLTAATGGSGSYTYQWNTGQTGSSITASPGQYIVTASDGLCSNADTVEVFPGPGAPVAAFTTFASCDEPTVTLDDSSQAAASSTITSWTWDLGDGSTATGPHLTYVYDSSGSYLVTLVIQSSSGCSDTTVMEVFTGGPPPIASFTATPVCLGSLSQFTDFSVPVTGVLSDWTWDFGDGGTSAIANPTHIYSTPGTHPVTLIVESTSGCYDTLTIPHTVYPEPIANAGNDTAICQNLSVTLTANGGASYTWTPGSASSASFTVTPVITSIYTVTVTDVNGCIATDDLTVTVNPLPNANAGSSVNVCENASTTLLATGGGTYLWNPGAVTSASFLITPTVTTVYTVVVTNAYACSDTDTVTVTLRTNPVAATGNDTVICLNNSVTLNATGGGTYLWTPGSSTASDMTVSPATTTTYTVTVTNAFGCQDTDQVQIRVNPLPIADAGNDTAMCLNANITLTASGGILYSWSPIISSTSSVNVAPLTTTVYHVSVTDANQCVATDSVRVAVNPLPPANAGSDQSICLHSQTTLVASGGLNYLWTPGSLTSATIAVNPAITTDYIVRVTDTNGCSEFDTLTVTVNPNPTAFAGNDTALCLNSSMTLSASGGGSYSWNPGNISSSSFPVTPLVTTDYTVTVTDLNNCMDSDVVRIVVLPNPVANAGTDTEICFNTLTTLTASGGSAYLWNPGNSSSSVYTVSPTVTTAYTVTVTDNNHCSASDTVNVKVNANPVAVAGPDTSICRSASVLLAGSGGGNYLWVPGNYNVQGITVSPTKTTEYSLMVTDTNGCYSIDWVQVIVNPMPVAAFRTNPFYCEGEALALRNFSRISSGALQYAWDFGNGFQSNLPEPVYAFTAAGSYTIQLTLLSDSGCLDTVTHSVIVNPNPTAAFAVSDICEMQSGSFINQSTISHPVPMRYKWNFGNGNTDTVPNPQVQYTEAGNFPVKLVVKAAGCADSVTHSFQVNPLPQAMYEGSAVCANSPVTFANNSAISWGTISGWQWDFGDSSVSAQRNPSHAYASSGSYNVSLIARSAAGCIDTTEAMVYVNPQPDPDFSVRSVCDGAPAIFTDRSTISAGNITRWIWNFGDGTISINKHPVKIYPSPGFYDVTLTVISDSGCSDTLRRPASIEIFKLPDVSFKATPEKVQDIFPHVEFTNFTAGNNFYYWDFGDGGVSQAHSPYHDFTSAGVFDVLLVATSLEGCMDSAWQRVVVEQGSGLYIPNTFTPNHDGENDVFRPVYYNINSISAEIFNRWGALIYRWNGTEGGWNGITDGQTAPLGVYVYKLIATDINGRTQAYQGHVNLVR